MFIELRRETSDRNSEIVGMNIIATYDGDPEILRRFFDGGIKINTISENNEVLGITFADLIKRGAK